MQMKKQTAKRQRRVRVRFRAAVFVLVWAIPAFPAKSVTVKITPDPKACTIVHLPKWKRAAGPDWMTPTADCEYDFRSSEDGFLVGLHCRPEFKDNQLYSPSKYAVSFGSGRVRKATDSEWNLAGPYLAFRLSTQEHWPIENYKPLVYRGRVFRKSGLTWPGESDIRLCSRLSPEGDFLAVNSWDGTIQFGGGLFDLSIHQYVDGFYYVDIYNSDSARRVLLIQGHFHDVDPTDMFRKSAWISKRYFVLPLDFENKMRNFVICDVAHAAESGN